MYAKAPFQIKTSEAMQYRRIAARELARSGMSPDDIEHDRISAGFGIRDGNGIVLVAHDGTVTPSGFLPLTIGNVRETSLVELYREHPTMQALRDPTGFDDRCGRCEY